MNTKIGEHELFVFVAGLVFTQLMVPAQTVPRDYAANAAWLSALLSLGIGALAALLLFRLAGGLDYFSVCGRLGLWSGLFPGLLALVFLLLSAVGLRGLMDMLEVYILSLTPRALVFLLLLFCLLPGSFYGPAAFTRMLGFYAPVALMLFFIVLIVALPHNAKLVNLFPLFGEGPVYLLKNAGRDAAAFLWLFLTLIELDKVQHARRGAVRAVAISTLLLCLGYLAYSLLNAPGSATETAYPLQQLASFSGYWRYFQRLQSLFVFAWVPLLLCTGAGGLCYSARCLAKALQIDDARVLLLPLAVLLGCLCAPSTESLPLWLRALLEGRSFYLFCAPILLLPYPLAAAKARRKRRQRHA